MHFLKLRVFALILGLASVAAVAGPYEAVQADTDLKVLVERWVKLEGKTPVWQAAVNVTIRDIATLNAFARLERAQTFVEALTRLNKELEYAYSDRSGRNAPRPLVACIFDNAIVIRTIDQPDCSTQL